eukprot:4111418-Prorocentrum_lima.AAC.1
MNSQTRTAALEERPQSIYGRMGTRMHEAEEPLGHEHQRVVTALEDIAMKEHESLMKQKE